ncbi:MAG: RHS repeat-associated core domain-containing protein [Marinilabiliales bacterium]|nr:RHS repeat-associated core domain-containing protein [Marinilabiliales bacterium]
MVEQSNGQRTPYLCNGKELDDVTGLYYYGARYYDPVTSIWENVDPSWDLPQQVDESPYAYVGNNPVVFSDPDGRVRVFGQGGVLNLLGYGKQKDGNLNWIDFSFLNKNKSPEMP